MGQTLLYSRDLREEPASDCGPVGGAGTPCSLSSSAKASPVRAAGELSRSLPDMCGLRLPRRLTLTDPGFRPRLLPSSGSAAAASTSIFREDADIFFRSPFPCRIARGMVQSSWPCPATPSPSSDPPPPPPDELVSLPLPPLKSCHHCFLPLVVPVCIEAVMAPPARMLLNRSRRQSQSS